MSISMALFSPPTHPPSLSPSISPKPHLTLKPDLSLRPPKTPFFLLSTTRASADNGASAATALEPEAGQKVVEKDESSAGANGSAGAAEAVEVKVVSKFEDRRWVGGTWDLKQFEKDGKPDWDAVIDAGWALRSMRACAVPCLRELLEPRSTIARVVVGQDRALKQRSTTTGVVVHQERHRILCLNRA